MNKIKKILFIVLPLVFIFIGVFFAIYYNVNRVDYTYSEEYNGYLVNRAYGNAKEYFIPEEYNGDKVVGINTRAFYNHIDLEKITFENKDNIKYIGRLSFSECKNLKEIDISSVNTIDKNAFYNCISLDNITIKAKYIAGSAFYGCDSLSNLILESGVSNIGTYAFSCCKSLKYLTVPKSIQKINDNCFLYTSFIELRVPLSFKNNAYLKSIENIVFY